MGGFIFIWILLAVGVALLADSRGRSGPGFFLLSALLSPLLGLIVVLVSRDLKEEDRKEQLRRQENERHLESIRALAAPRQVAEAPADAPAKPTVGSIADEVRKLGQLRDEGLLTDDEFRAEKARLFGHAAPAAVAPPKPVPMGECPNCSATIPLGSQECPKCHALFGVGSTWGGVRPI